MDKRIAHFHLSIGVKSLQKSVDFFEQTLGALVQHRDPSGYVNIDFYGVQITLKESIHAIPDLPEFHFGANMSLAAFNQLEKLIVQKDPNCIVMPAKIVDAGTAMERKKMYVKFPTGYLIEIKGYGSIL